jgi:hypothetical protein
LESETDIGFAGAEAGHIAKAPMFNTLFERFENPDMALQFIEKSTAPLANIESNFAVDSTGFGTATYRRWYNAKYGKEMCEHAWLKALVVRFGTLALMAQALKLKRDTLRHSMDGRFPVNVEMAFRVSRLACVPFDDVTTAKHPLKGTCPHCGYVKDGEGPRHG